MFDEGVVDAFDVLVTCAGATVSVHVRGELDVVSVDVLRTALDGAFVVGLGDVAVDLSQTTFCDSTCLWVLLAAHRRLEDVGRRLRLVDPAPRVVRLLELSATRNAFNITASSSPSCSAGDR
jgi:anti-anti-sigma factor